ncbi:MAG: DUF4878 domain-containing protein [Bacteroidales bacterium]|jgi:hypothetical protein|nr:DUF4878 domain-containing protein [Bacteroidales bacterium]
MNKIFCWFFTFLLMAGCYRSNNPQKVAEIFLHDISTGNFRHARKYVTPNTLSYLINAESILPPHDSIKSHPVFYKIEKIEMNGDTARCDIIWDETKENLLIIRQQGRWLVDLNI